jgi:hypothetical protein
MGLTATAVIPIRHSVQPLRDPSLKIQCFHECAQRRGVNGAVDQFEQRLVLEAVDHAEVSLAAEHPLPWPCRNGRTRAIYPTSAVPRTTLSKFHSVRCPAKNPAD